MCVKATGAAHSRDQKPVGAARHGGFRSAQLADAILTNRRVRYGPGGGLAAYCRTRSASDGPDRRAVAQPTEINRGSP